MTSRRKVPTTRTSNRLSLRTSKIAIDANGPIGVGAAVLIVALATLFAVFYLMPR